MNAQSELEGLRNEVFDGKRDLNRDKIILGYIFYGLFNSLLLLFLNQLFTDWYASLTAKVLYGIFSIGWFILPLLLAYQIKHENFRKIGIPMATLYLIVKIGIDIYNIIEPYYL
ncbi:MAG: hypothetical protein AB8H47_24105 [Bacteroidia bacterium]